jgi:hypothetical protein
VPAAREGNRLSDGAMPFSTHSTSATSSARMKEAERLYGAIQAVRYGGLDLSHLYLP